MKRNKNYYRLVTLTHIEAHGRLVCGLCSVYGCGCQRELASAHVHAWLCRQCCVCLHHIISSVTDFINLANYTILLHVEWCDVNLAIIFIPFASSFLKCVSCIAMIVLGFSLRISLHLFIKSFFFLASFILGDKIIFFNLSSEVHCLPYTYYSMIFIQCYYLVSNFCTMSSFYDLWMLYYGDSINYLMILECWTINIVSLF